MNQSLLVAAPLATEASLDLPMISVVVPVRNESAFIGRTIDRLLAQDYPAERVEIIVADGRSTDNTAQIVRQYAARDSRVMLVDNPGRLSSAGRNAAVRKSSGDFILLVDGHCQLDDTSYLSTITELFERTEADCLARPQPLDVHGANPTQRAIARARKSFAGHNPSSYIYSDAEGFINPESSAVAYRREVFTAVGYFDERFDACEDVEFNHRLHQRGLRCYFSPRLSVKYHPRASLNALARQMQRYGTGRVRLMRKHRDSFSLAAIAPPLLIVTLVACLLLTPLASPFAWIGATVSALYLTFIVLGTLQASRGGCDTATLVRLPAVFMAVHAGFGWGVLRECARQLRMGWRA